MTHELHIESLRDLRATCSCGSWTLASPTVDTDSDMSIRARAEAQHRLHTHPSPVLAATRRREKLISRLRVFLHDTAVPVSARNDLAHQIEDALDAIKDERITA
jgi:hypothetical protein